MKKFVFFAAVCAGVQLCVLSAAAFAQEPIGIALESDPFHLKPVPEAYGAANVRAGWLPQRRLRIDPAARTLILITFGQSLMANFHAITSPIYVPTNSPVIDNFNIYDGAAYAFVRAPALGCNGYFSNVATRVADMLVNKRVFDRVIVVPIAIGSTTISEWTMGDFAGRFRVAMRRLATQGITPGTPGVTFTAVWGQGESDTRDGTSRDTYRERLDILIKNVVSSGFSGRLFVNVETYYFGNTSPEIQAAQASVVNGTTVLQGANSDALGRNYREPDNLHPSELGAPVFALALYNAMRASGPPS